MEETDSRERFSLLRDSRRVDWRWLLPEPHLGRVAFVGEGGSDLLSALRGFADEVEHVDPARLTTSHSAAFDGIVVVADAAFSWTAAARALVPGGWVYTEVDRRRVLPAVGVWRHRRREILSAGFEAVEAYWNFPSFAFRRALVPLHDRVAIRGALRRRAGSLGERLTAAVAQASADLGLFPWLVRHVSHIAVLPGGAGSGPALSTFVARHWNDSDAATAPASFLLTPPGVESKSVVAIYCSRAADGPLVVAKASRSPGERHGSKAEARNLVALRASWPDVGDSAPRLLAEDSLAGHTVVLETPVQGTPIDPYSIRRDRHRAIGFVSEWLLSLAAATAAPAPVDWFERLVHSPILRVSVLVPEDDLPILVDRTLELLRPLRNEALSTVFEHGDLADPNVLVAPGGQVGVVDWERAVPDGLPGQDMIFFLSYAAFAARRAETLEERVAAFDKAFLGPSRWAAAAIVTFFERAGIDRSLFAPLALACWARYVAALAETLVNSDAPEQPAPPATRRHILGSWELGLWRHVAGCQGELAAAVQ